MNITALHARLIRIPRTATLKTSYGDEDTAPTILVTLETDAGITGVGQASIDMPFYGETAEGMLANIRSHLAPAVIGQDPHNITLIQQLMRKALPHHLFSHAGVDMALFDLKGKALGVPLYDLLGGKVRPGLTLMGFVHLDTPQKMADEARKLLDDHGYSVLKMKIGLEPKEDLERYRAVAKVVSGRAVIQADGNTGYTIDQALPTLKQMQDLGSLGAVEQPVARMHDMATLASRLHAPIMADEAIYPPEDAIEVIRTGAASLALMKISKHGGIDNVHKIGMLFEAAGLSLSVAIYYDLIGVAAAHLAAALPAVTWPSPATSLQDTILKTPLTPEGLSLAAPDAPGLGVELDWDKVERYTVNA
jgi:muconate cycloisomerase